MHAWNWSFGPDFFSWLKFLEQTVAICLHTFTHISFQNYLKTLKGSCEDNYQGSVKRAIVKSSNVMILPVYKPQNYLMNRRHSFYLMCILGFEEFPQISYYRKSTLFWKHISFCRTNSTKLIRKIYFHRDW